MALMRVKARWTIPGAGTAFSVFHFGTGPDDAASDQEASNATGAVQTFFNAVKAYIPSQVAIDVMTDVEVIEIATGNLQGVVSAAAQTQIIGGATSTQPWSAPSGACITWTTGSLRTLSSKPRRVRGRTFLVPLTSTAYENNGTLSAACLTALNTAATGLRGNFNGQEFRVYGRPGKGGAPAGMDAVVTGHRITDQSAVLRSRRS